MLCSRCGARESEVKTRGENFCKECYSEFVGRKFRNIMSTFRVNGSPDSHVIPPLLLVPVSFGVSSLAMVDLLLEMQRSQKTKHNGMTGFRLLCVHLSDEELPFEWPWPDTAFVRMPKTDIFKKYLPELDEKKKLSRSSKHDIEAIMIRRVCLAIAAEHDVEATLFGCSMTRLSELTLAETVKGRGAGIPALVSPDLKQDKVVYPLRDITLPELEKYCSVRSLEQYVLPDPQVPGITKMQSIDEIVHSYFADVQKGFPSVVSTVAKVASKLSQDAEPCDLCQGGNGVTLCYACKAALGEEHLQQPPSRAQLSEILEEYTFQ